MARKTADLRAESKQKRQGKSGRNSRSFSATDKNFVNKLKDPKGFGVALEHFKKRHQKIYEARSAQIQVSLPKTLGVRILNWRVKNEVSIPQLAKHLGVSNRFISNLENGFALPYNDIDRASKGFSVPLELDNLDDEEEKWVPTDGDRITQIIFSLSLSLQELIKVVTTDNELISRDDILDPIQRAQLIAILEAALVEFKAPKVNVKKANGLLQVLRRIGLKAAEKEATERVQDALDTVIDGAQDLVKEASSLEGISEISDMFF